MRRRPAVADVPEAPAPPAPRRETLSGLLAGELLRAPGGRRLVSSGAGDVVSPHDAPERPGRLLSVRREVVARPNE